MRATTQSLQIRGGERSHEFYGKMSAGASIDPETCLMPQRDREERRERRDRERERGRGRSGQALWWTYRRTEAGTKGTHLRLPRSALASWLAVGQAGRPTNRPQPPSATALSPTPTSTRAGQPRQFVSNSSSIPLLVRANRITSYISVCRIRGNSVNH